MRKRTNILAVALLALLAGATPLMAQENKAQPAAGMPKVGDMAPDFKLGYFDGNQLKQISLDDYRGKKNVILAFFIFAFTGG
jgi:hypothetical protein